jgi:hypothetical protein
MVDSLEVVILPTYPRTNTVKQSNQGDASLHRVFRFQTCEQISYVPELLVLARRALLQQGVSSSSAIASDTVSHGLSPVAIIRPTHLGQFLTGSEVPMGGATSVTGLIVLARIGLFRRAAVLL